MGTQSWLKCTPRQNQSQSQWPEMARKENWHGLLDRRALFLSPDLLTTSYMYMYIDAAFCFNKKPTCGCVSNIVKQKKIYFIVVWHYLNNFYSAFAGAASSSLSPFSSALCHSDIYEMLGDTEESNKNKKNSPSSNAVERFSNENACSSKLNYML